jgi:hypothetical protein
MCIDHVGLFTVYPGMRGMEVGVPCPQWPDARPTAVVNVERPFFVTLGFSFTTLGFLLQILSIPSPKTIAQMQAEVRIAKKQIRIKEEQAKLTRIYPAK